jgi:hypothetical protein
MSLHEIAITIEIIIVDEQYIIRREILVLGFAGHSGGFAAVFCVFPMETPCAKTLYGRP